MADRSDSRPSALAIVTAEMAALTAAHERLRCVLAEIADYADERRHAIIDGQGLAQHALHAIANTARRAIGVPEPASGGVVEPSGPLTAEEAAPVVSIEPDPMLHGHNDGSGLDHGCPECQLKLAAVAARVRAAYGMPAEETRPIDGIKVISNRPRMTDGCGPEHTFTGSCELEDWGARG